MNEERCCWIMRSEMRSFSEEMHRSVFVAGFYTDKLDTHSFSRLNFEVHKTVGKEKRELMAKWRVTERKGTR